MITRTHCSEIVRQVVRREGWPLEPADLDALTNRVLPLVGESALSDDELVVAIRNYYLDGPAVEALLDYYSTAGEQLWQDVRMIYLRIGRARQLDLAQAEDLAQLALERAVQNLAGFQFRSRLKTWLTRVWLSAYAEAYRRIQAKKRGGAGRHASDSALPLGSELSLDVEDEAEIGVQHEGYDQVDSRQVSRYLFDLLAELLTDEDVIILHRYYVERTYADPEDGQPRKWADAAIARSLGRKTNTVISRRHRALKRLALNPAIRQLAEDILGVSLNLESDRNQRKKNQVIGV